MHLEIRTPDQQVFEGEVTSVQLPGSKDRGSLQILDNHAPLISSLQPGKIVVTKGNEERVFFVKHGFVEVLENRVAVLVEEVEQAVDSYD